MQVYKSNWLKRKRDGSWRSRFFSDSDPHSLRLCRKSLRRKFDVPADVVEVQVAVYTTPSPSRLEVHLPAHPGASASTARIGRTYVFIGNIRLATRIRAARQKHLYVELWYRE